MRIDPGYFVEYADWSRDREELLAVRREVFELEQGVPREEELDGLDPLCRHVLARDLARRPIGTARLAPDGKIGRMAVLAAWRGRGVGSQLLAMLVALARELGLRELWCHAQLGALPFYERHGFRAEGEVFVEAGIAHRRMRFGLEPAWAPERPSLPPPAAEPVIVADREQAERLVLRLLAQARRELALVTRHLDPGLLDSPPVLEALKRFAIGGRARRVRILVHDLQPAVSGGHRLIELIQRLPSIFELRHPGDDQDRQFPGAFLIDDRGGFLFRPLAVRFEGEGDLHAPLRHRELAAWFDAMWERGLPSVELRRLSI
ncbi:MAG: GNAT family N-acetyltransferase [Xanthomonadales bacterium]|nr:GNAT family N-acetyltransferase [Xanthomonadales bacterium]